MVAENQPGHIDQIKQTNAGAVYRLIDQLGPVSRIDLSRLAQLAPASITKIVREMLEAHLVQELEIKEAGNRGRPAVGLVVETEAWHYLSLRISRGEIFLALRDLSSKLVVEESQELALKDDSPLLDRIISHIDQFFIRHQKKLERLTSIAITLPGIIDTENGIVHRMPFYEDVKEMPLGEALEQHTGVPVYIQHDISAWTMAEALFGASRGARDVIQVVIDHNVGAGVITDGHLLHAGSSSLVEIGHTQVDPYGKLTDKVDHVVVEGTGGWRSLMNDLRPLSEWVVQEQLPVLMVVGIQEGCINHALLTAQAIANDGLPLIGWVANRINPGLAHYAEIIDVLGKKLPAPLIGELPYLPRAEQRELGQYIRLAMLRSVLAVDRVTV